MSEPQASTRSTFPLSLLFLIVTGAAAAAALIGAVLREIPLNHAELPELLITLIVAPFSGAVLGALVGLFQFHRLLGVGVGLAVGGILGPMAALVMLVPAAKISSLVPVVCIGCVLLVIVAWLIRPSPPPEDESAQATLVKNERQQTSPPPAP